ncbi:alpha-amylase [Chlorella sorokiniana]|uniref:Alpha-amylase n=1 Tax=Chlorella sorokiniana TaxID=3076 RepID=A0A2P6U2W1_CHLSO|nr:alpha-amylase [Chlorella sorokiniana]|eukprot:PRW60649.1 alpha-amylase [Chlorella sorokiniana]
MVKAAPAWCGVQRVAAAWRRPDCLRPGADAANAKSSEITAQLRSQPSGTGSGPTGPSILVKMQRRKKVETYDSDGASGSDAPAAGGGSLPGPPLPAASGAHVPRSVGTGFGSVLHFGGSEPTSRRSSFAPQQAAEAAAEAAAAAAAEELSVESAAGPPDWAAQSPAAPAALPAGGPPSSAGAEAAAAAQQAPQLPAAEEAGSPPAAEEEAWPEQPVTSFQVAARPLFGSAQDEAAAAFDGLGSPAQPAESQPAFAYSQPDASYAPEAAGAPQEDPHAFDFLEEIRSPTAADEALVAPQQPAPTQEAAAAEPLPAAAPSTGAAEAPPAAAPSLAAEQPAEPVTWYDESGYCCLRPLSQPTSTAFGKLLFGGRVLLAVPSGHLELHALQRGPPEVLQPLPGAPTTSLSALLQTLESFPGPLGSGSKADKVASFCGEQADAAGADPTADYASCEGRRTLWSVLRVLAAHQGRASSAPYSLLPASSQGSGKPADPAAAPEAQLAAALLEGVPPVSELQLRLPAAAPPPETAAAVAAQVQQLLLEGRRTEALRVAVDGQLWAIALLLSRLLGDAAVAGTAAAMAQRCVAQAAPLQTLLLLLGVLLGVDAAAQPRACAHFSAILATEVYTWSRTVGNTALSGQYLPVVPYKLLHAYALAELGLVQQAAAYCQSMERTLQALGNKVPPGLLVCRAVAADLRDRLQQYATGQKLSLGSGFTAGALVSSVGKWLDRGLTAMMGGGDAAGTGGGRHSRNPSTSSVDASKEAVHRRTASSSSLMGGGAPPADGGSGGGGGGSIFHRVSSIKNMLTGQSSKAKIDAPPAAAAAAQQPGSPENVFYYDHELKCWRERGAEPPKPEQPPPPPPTGAVYPGGSMSSSPQKPPPMPAPAGQAGLPPRSGVGSRYALAGSSYCGGTFKGLVDQLDYIKGLGMDAIWLSPVSVQSYGGYHGYWPLDMFNINPSFGTPMELQRVLQTLEDEGFRTILDVVWNHVGYNTAPLGTPLNPYNLDEYFNNCTDLVASGMCLPDCTFPEWDTKIEQARGMLEQYRFHALRVDAAGYMEPEFVSWAVNETRLAGWLETVPSPIHLYEQARQQSVPYSYQSYELYSTTLINNSTAAYHNALAYTLLSEAIPLILYGAEQGLDGAQWADEHRLPLWHVGYNTSSPLYQFIRTLAWYRRQLGLASLPLTQAFVNNDTYAFARGPDMLVVLTSGAYNKTKPRPALYSLQNLTMLAGRELCDLFSPPKRRNCVSVGQNGTAAVVPSPADEPMVFVTRQWLEKQPASAACQLWRLSLHGALFSLLLIFCFV